MFHIPKRMYKGVMVTILRDLPSYGVYFASYRSLALALEPNVAPEDASAATQVLAGGSAGAREAGRFGRWGSGEPLCTTLLYTVQDGDPHIFSVMC